MRWRRRARRDEGNAAPADSSNGYKPGSWGQAVAPPSPSDYGGYGAPTGNVEVIPAPVAPPPSNPVDALMPPPLVSPPTAAPQPPAPAAAPAPAPAPIAPAAPDPPPPAASAPPAPASVPEPTPDDEGSSAVRLGFTDGSDLHLDPDHPHSLALKAIADVLLHRGPSRRRVS